MASNLDTLWNEVLNVIKVELSEVSFNTWLKSIEPISLSDNKIILAVPNDFTKGILQGRYYNLIKNSISQVTKEDYKIEFIIPGEDIVSNNGQNIISETIENNQKSQLNPKYTFNTFVIGNSNRFAHAASLAVAEAPAQDIILCLYTVELV